MTHVHDLVIRNGLVVDGTGGEPRVADVAIVGDKVVAVGADLGEGKQTIDATGLIVTPGWVDIHTHYDGQATWDPELTPSGWHGVTTVVMGNCGVGFAPARADQREWLIQLMEGVEDIPGTALAEGMTWNWETFPEYLDELEQLQRTVDVAALVPHGAVRAYVLGEGRANDGATDEEIAHMAELVADGIAAGAVGFSTTRTILHRAKDGELAAGTTAAPKELRTIANAMGAGVFEMVSDFIDPTTEFRWMEQISLESGRPVTWANLQDDGRPEGWRDRLALSRAANGRGANLVPQVAGRPACLILGWNSSAHPFMYHQTWGELVPLDPQERLKQVQNAEFKERLLAEDVSVNAMATFWMNNFAKLYELGDPPDYEPDPANSLAQRAASGEAQSPAALAYDLMSAHDGTGKLYWPILGYSYGNFDALEEMLRQPDSVLGLGDGGAHCGVICDASLPTYMLAYWARDRVRGDRLSLAEAVHHQTQRTAQLYGFHDRGVLAPGYLADVNVIDLDALHIPAPELVYDLPAGGRRLIQRVQGYVATIKRGQVVRENDTATGARPGVVVRGAQPAPALA